MGCDIHFYVEKRDGPDAPWTSADEWVTEHEGKSDEYVFVPAPECYYAGRNYHLFAILAGVRNYNHVAPIREPRGLPPDASPEVRRACEDGGFHSHNHLTVRELLEYDWTQTATVSGVMTGVDLWHWLDKRERWQDFTAYPIAPSRYARALGGGRIENVSSEEQERRVREVADRARETFDGLAEEKHRETTRNEFVVKALHNAGLHFVVAQHEWEQPYYRLASDFLANTLPRLLALGEPSDVRCVFWFDN